jgi:hypothetical protein
MIDLLFVEVQIFIRILERGLWNSILALVLELSHYHLVRCQHHLQRLSLRIMRGMVELISYDDHMTLQRCGNSSQ